MSGAINRMYQRRYLAGLDALRGDVYDMEVDHSNDMDDDIFGDPGKSPESAPMTYGPDKDFVGPMTPAQLANLNRALTPAEQSAVSAAQSADADRQQAAERKKGGPTSATVSVTPQGAVIRAEPSPKGAPPSETPGLFGVPWWVLALAGLGTVAIGVGVYEAVS